MKGKMMMAAMSLPAFGACVAQTMRLRLPPTGKPLDVQRDSEALSLEVPYVVNESWR